MPVTLEERAPTTPRLAGGVELLGAYEGSGCLDPPHLLRRPDGQVIQVPRLLYLVASSLDDETDLERVADRVSRESGLDVSAENVDYLVDKQLRPAGLVASAASDETADAAPPPRANPLLGLKLRVGLVPERAHRVITNALRPLFWPPIIAVALVALVAVDAWLFIGNGSDVIAGARQVIYQPQLLLLLTGLTIAGGAFHEFGHATAARYGGAVPGSMGAGVYLIWPVFFTDVTDSYRLDRRGRLRTDLGGVYFNVLFALVIAAAYAATGYAPLAVFLVLGQLETLQQFLPIVRLDGYYVVSDLIGVPNLFSYLRPVLVGITRRGDENARRAAEAKLANLKPWARRLVKVWVCTTAPILAINAVLFVIFAPRLAGAAWGSVQRQVEDIGRAHADGDLAGLVNGTLSVLLLALPVAGAVYLLVMMARRLVRGTRRWWRIRPLGTAGGVTILAVVLALQIGVVWPDTFRTALERSQPSAEVQDAGPGTAEAEAERGRPAASAASAASAANASMAPEGVEPGPTDLPAMAPDSSRAVAETATGSTAVEPAAAPSTETETETAAPSTETGTGTGTEAEADASAADAAADAECHQAGEGEGGGRRTWLDELECQANAQPASRAPTRSGAVA